MFFSLDLILIWVKLSKINLLLNTVADDIFIILFYFPQNNKVWHFM